MVLLMVENVVEVVGLVLGVVDAVTEVGVVVLLVVEDVVSKACPEESTAT